jgi:hypothetical protein
MKDHLITCSSCGKRITKKSDINILSFIGLSTKTFCNDCYAKKDREFKHHFMLGSSTPINSRSNLYSLIGSTVFGIILTIVVLVSDSFQDYFFLWFALAMIYDIVITRQWIQYFKIKRFVNALSD